MKCKVCNQPFDLIERVTTLRAWARSRIEWCHDEEKKFGAGDMGIEAAQERRTLQAVLRQLGTEW